jgi:hypothetical protein
MCRAIVRKFLSCLGLACLCLFLSLTVLPITPSFASTRPQPKPSLLLNREQGPLGVTLTLRGKNFPPGQASLSYIDAKNVPGVFAPPAASTVEVLPDGSFLTTNLVMPAAGPAGAWKIVVTDSNGALNTIRYTALLAKGQSAAGAPTLTLSLPSTINGDAPSGTTASNNAITFTGANWLPKGTAVKLLLMEGASSSIPLLEPAPISDIEGNIHGSFYLPATISVPDATILASDVSTGALRAQVPISINDGLVSLTPVATAQSTDASTSSVAANTQPQSTSSQNGGVGSFVNSLGKLDSAVWGPILLIVGGILLVAGFMLLLFMIPWSSSNRRQ